MHFKNNNHIRHSTKTLDNKKGVSDLVKVRYLAPVKLHAQQRILVHNIDILSLLFGSLLGNSDAECRNNKIPYIRFILQQENSNVEYLL
jgi:hypothetical protein